MIILEKKIEFTFYFLFQYENKKTLYRNRFLIYWINSLLSRSQTIFSSSKVFIIFDSFVKKQSEHTHTHRLDHIWAFYYLF